MKLGMLRFEWGDRAAEGRQADAEGETDVQWPGSWKVGGGQVSKPLRSRKGDFLASKDTRGF